MWQDIMVWLIGIGTLCLIIRNTVHFFRNSSDKETSACCGCQMKCGEKSGNQKKKLQIKGMRRV